MARFNTKAFRERHGLTQKELAEKIPVAIRTVERWEQETGQLFDPSPLAVYRMRALDDELSGKTSVKRRQARRSTDTDTEPSFARPSGVLPSIR